jgi:hypothetical protein
MAARCGQLACLRQTRGGRCGRPAPHSSYTTTRDVTRFDEAGVALTRGAVRTPEALWPHVFLAACYGLRGNDAQASAQLVEVRRINPKFSIAALLKLLPCRRSADIDRLVDGLRKAGLTT